MIKLPHFKHILNNMQSTTPTKVDLKLMSTIVAKADSGASKHFWRYQDQHILHNITPCLGPAVGLPDGNTIRATKSGSLPIRHLSSAAKTVQIFKGLRSASLISIGQLCDDGCEVALTKNNMIVKKKQNIILTGKRNNSDGLWDVELSQNGTTHNSGKNMLPLHTQPNATEYKANVIIRKSQTKLELAQYLHAACWSPPISTFVRAIKNGNFISWPGLTPQLITKHLSASIATAKGHLDQESKNLQSTKIQIKTEEDNTDSNPPQNTKTHNCFALLSEFHDLKKAYLDLPGKFPTKSSRGNQYFLIVYDYDSNAILAKTLKSRQAAEIRNAWQEILKILEKGGNTPEIFIMDNEASNELKKAMAKHKIQYQLVPPDMHRRNAAERAIRVWKNHFVTGLCLVDPNFPKQEWDRLVEHAYITINLLRNARANPKLSAYSYLHGPFDFNRTPLAPPGTKVLVHSKPSNRASWDPHGIEGWFIGPSMEHYRCVKCYMPKTFAERDSDTVAFFPHSVPFPKVTTDDFLRQSISDIIAILQKNPPSTVPSLQAGDQTRAALQTIADLLNRSVTPPAAPLLPAPSQLNPPLPIQPAQLPRVPLMKDPVPAPRVNPSPMSTDTQNHHDQSPRVVDITAAEPSQHRYETRSKTTLYNKLPPRPHPINVPTPKQSNNTEILPQPPKRLPFQPMHRYRPYSRNFRSTAVQVLKAQAIFLHQPTLNMSHVYNEVTGKRETMHSLLNGPDKELWKKALSNEIGRLAHGNIHGVKYTDTIEFITRNDLPSDAATTYASFVCDIRPLKSETHRVRLVVGGDKLPYAADSSSPAASLLETKLLINSVISDHNKTNAKFCTADLKDFFLATPMEKPEYMKLQFDILPDDIKLKYDLHNKVTPDNYIYVKIVKGMYGLKQAAILAYTNLVDQLKPHGYEPCPYTTGLWKHKTRDIHFCLCVDDFGIKYTNESDKQHLLTTLAKYYTVTKDDSGTNYCGLTIDWHYDDGYVDISMPGYIQKVLHRYQHPQPSRAVNTPHEYNVPVYGKRVQYAPPEDTSPLLDSAGTKYIQGVVGSLLYYARAIDSTLLTALNEISGKQARPTQHTKNAVHHLLNYVATHPHAVVRYYASDMILHIDSDASYLVLPGAKSRIAGYFQLIRNKNSAPFPKGINGAILVECKTLKHVVASAAEAETGGIFHNAQIGIIIRTALEELGHPQPKTGIKTDNSTATNFANASLRQKRSKSWDMRYNWLRDRIAQLQFIIYWASGKNNDADFTTKHFPPGYTLQMRQRYLQHVTLTLNHLMYKLSEFDSSRREGVFLPSGLSAARNLSH